MCPRVIGEPSGPAKGTRARIDGLKVLPLILGSSGSFEPGCIRMIRQDAPQQSRAAAVQATNENQSFRVDLARVHVHHPSCLHRFGCTHDA